MATNLALDDQLIEEALIIGQHKTKKEAVNAALKEYIQVRKQKEIIKLFQKIDFAEDYNYKKGRARK